MYIRKLTRLQTFDVSVLHDDFITKLLLKCGYTFLSVLLDSALEIYNLLETLSLILVTDGLCISFVLLYFSSQCVSQLFA